MQRSNVTIACRCFSGCFHCGGWQRRCYELRCAARESFGYGHCRSVTERGSLQLYYDTNVEATTAVLATFSTACFGYVFVLLSTSRAAY